MKINYSEEGRYIKAKKHVEDIKGFYIHFGVYVTINLFISTLQIADGVTEYKSFSEIFSDFGMYAVWLFWGIGVFFHWFGVFGFSSVLGKNWEDKKIKEYMDSQDKL